MAFVRRLVKGSALTAAEFDGNIDETESRLEALEGLGATDGRGIVSITQAGGGSQFTITYTDATTDTFTVASAKFSARGEWAAATNYFVDDVILDSTTGLYGVLKTHTSAGSFDPDAVNGTGDPLYWLMLPVTGGGGGGSGSGGGGGGSAPLHRCMATRSSAITATSGSTTIPFNSEAYDTASIHDNTTDSDRLVTPTGATLVRVGCTVYFQSVTATNYVYAAIRRSAGTSTDAKQLCESRCSVGTGDNAATICMSSGPIVVAGANEYFDLYYEADDASFNIGEYSNFWIEVLA